MKTLLKYLSYICRYEGHNQAIPHEREITNRDVKQTHDTDIPFYQETTTGKVVQGFSDETSGRSFARTTHEIRTDHIEKTNYRRKTSLTNPRMTNMETNLLMGLWSMKQYVYQLQNMKQAFLCTKYQKRKTIKSRQTINSIDMKRLRIEVKQ